MNNENQSENKSNDPTRTELHSTRITYDPDHLYFQPCGLVDLRMIRMKRLCLEFIALLFIAGCAASPAKIYRPRGYYGDAWKIKATIIPGLINQAPTELTIQVNGQKVIKEKLSSFQNSYELEGKYEGFKIIAKCSKVNNWQDYSSWRVLVFVDNEIAATF